MASEVGLMRWVLRAGRLLAGGEDVKARVIRYTMTVASAAWAQLKRRPEDMATGEYSLGQLREGVDIADRRMRDM